MISYTKYIEQTRKKNDNNNKCIYIIQYTVYIFEIEKLWTDFYEIFRKDNSQQYNRLHFGTNLNTDSIRDLFFHFFNLGNRVFFDIKQYYSKSCGSIFMKF